MRLLFRQRFFSWFDSYDIYNDNEETVYTVKGQLSIGHCLTIYDANNNRIGMVQEKFLTFLPKFEIYKNNEYIGCLSKELSFFTPHYNIDYNGWHIDGTLTEWNYTIVDESYVTVAIIRKEIFNFTDTYVIDVKNPENVLDALMFVLAIDAEKCTRNKRQNY